MCIRLHQVGASVAAATQSGIKVAGEKVEEAKPGEAETADFRTAGLVYVFRPQHWCILKSLVDSTFV